MSEKQGLWSRFRQRLVRADQEAKSKDGPQPGVSKLRRKMVTGSVVGVLGVNFFMFLRFFFPRTLFEPNTVFIVGYPSDFGFGVDTRFQQADRIDRKSVV